MILIKDKIILNKDFFSEALKKGNLKILEFLLKSKIKFDIMDIEIFRNIYICK